MCAAIEYDDAYNPTAQTIAIKLRADEFCKSKAEINNNMLWLLLIACNMDSPPPWDIHESVHPHVYPGNEEHSYSANFSALYPDDQSPYYCFYGAPGLSGGEA
jgi:hypothetical protein